MELYELHILKRLLTKHCIGAKHTAIEHCYGGLPKHAQYAAKYFTKELIKKEFILLKKTEYGNQVSLNPDRLPEIRNMIEDDKN